SHKVGFCIAPSDPVNLLAPHAVWQPPFIGFGDFSCGSPTALWVQEMMPVGWGDTYTQFVAGNAFDITSVPNGTYYIEVIANPQHVLYESNTRNDVSLRKVILGGTPGHRPAKPPAWPGMHPEGGPARRPAARGAAGRQREETRTRPQAVAGGRVTDSSGGVPRCASTSTSANCPVHPWLRLDDGRSAVS